jgi:hypothetical protein
VNLLRAIFHRETEADRVMESLTRTSWEGKTSVKSEVLFASREYLDQEKLAAYFRDVIPKVEKACVELERAKKVSRETLDKRIDFESKRG